MEKNGIFTSKVFVRYTLLSVSCTDKFFKPDNPVIPTSVEFIASDRSECHLAIPGGVPANFNWRVCPRDGVGDLPVG